MSPDPIIGPTLREYLERRLDYERELVTQRFELLDRALQLQASEYQRRLDVLNHAHAAAVKEQARVLPREMHDAFVKEYDNFKLEATKQFQVAHGHEGSWVAMQSRFDLFDKEHQLFKLDTARQLQAIATRSATWTAALGVVFAVLGLLMRFWP